MEQARFKTTSLITPAAISERYFPVRGATLPAFIRLWSFLDINADDPAKSRIGITIGRASWRSDAILTAVQMAALCEISRFGPVVMPDVSRRGIAFPSTKGTGTYSADKISTDRPRSPRPGAYFRYGPCTWLVSYKRSRDEFSCVRLLWDDREHPGHRERCLWQCERHAVRYGPKDYDVAGYQQNLRSLFTIIDQHQEENSQ